MSMMQDQTRDSYTISTNPTRLDPVAIHAYLTRAYWSTGRPYDTVVQSLQHSLCFGVYHEDTPQQSMQIGLARVITDYTLFAFLCDVYIL